MRSFFSFLFRAKVAPTLVVFGLITSACGTRDYDDAAKSATPAAGAASSGTATSPGSAGSGAGPAPAAAVPAGATVGAPSNTGNAPSSSIRDAARGLSSGLKATLLDRQKSLANAKKSTSLLWLAGGGGAVWLLWKGGKFLFRRSGSRVQGHGHADPNSGPKDPTTPPNSNPPTSPSSPAGPAPGDSGNLEVVPSEAPANAVVLRPVLGEPTNRWGYAKVACESLMRVILGAPRNRGLQLPPPEVSTGPAGH